MSFIIECNCGQKMTVEDHHAGQEVRCVNCSQVLRVPQKPADGAVATAHPSRVEVPGSAPAPDERTFPYGALKPGMKPHRGSLILTLGILSLICCGLLGIPAWIMGNADLQEMRAGRMDPSGEGLTNAGRIIGIVETVLIAVGLTIALLWAMIAIASGSFH